MTREETLMIMAVMKAAYPDHYKGMKPKDASAIVALWAELLEPYSYELCAFAAKRLITESPYPPKISDIVTRAKEALNPKQDDALEAWNTLAKAASRASIVTQEEFDALPYEAKRFCGSLSGLRDMGLLEADIFATVTRGQFMKVYDGLKRSRETLELMPPELLALTQKAVKPDPPRPKLLTMPEIKALDAPVYKNEYLAESVVTEEPSEIMPPLTETEWVERRDEMLERLRMVTSRGAV